jgi:2-phosphosulfolactate phosphatase
MTTTNGTRAFHACPADSLRLAGSLYNAGAVATKALELAVERAANLHLVCSGAADTFALDDAVCAGYLIQEIQRQAEASGRSLALHESALAALALYAAYPPPEVFAYSYAAQAISQAGLADDLPMCMSTSVSQSVGIVVGQEETTGLLVIERA